MHLSVRLCEVCAHVNACMHAYVHNVCNVCAHTTSYSALLQPTLPFFLTPKGRLRQLQEAFCILVLNGSSVCVKRTFSIDLCTSHYLQSILHHIAPHALYHS